jgi:hypothetical protein
LGSILANALPEGNILPAGKGYLAQVVATEVWPERAVNQTQARKPIVRLVDAVAPLVTLAWPPVLRAAESTRLPNRRSGSSGGTWFVKSTSSSDSGLWQGSGGSSPLSGTIDSL